MLMLYVVQNWYSYQYTCLQEIEYIKSKPKFTELLLQHLATSAVMDLLLRLITCVEGTENKQNILTVSLEVFHEKFVTNVFISVVK